MALPIEVQRTLSVETKSFMHAIYSPGCYGGETGEVLTTTIGVVDMNEFLDPDLQTPLTV